MSGIATTKEWIERIIPNPSRKDQSTQLGCLVEEFSELLNEVEFFENPLLLQETKEMVEKLATALKQSQEGVLIGNRIEFLDAICDIQVTTVTTAYTQGMAVVAALDAVNESNESKLVDGKPTFDENHKLKKGPNYFKVNLSPYV